MNRLMRFALVAVALLSTAIPALAKDPPPLTLRDDLAVFHRAITTSSPEAQKWFDQGLVLFYGFNLEASNESFANAAKLDPTCAMAWWGQALATGPHINNPTMDDKSAKAAYDAAQKAISLEQHASPVERELIHAIAARYAWPRPEDRKSLDVAYADAMRKAWKAYPNDADVGALAADAIMNLVPWDLYVDGKARPEALEIDAILEPVLKMTPDHPMANHLMIHSSEMSPTPERGLPAANLLRTRVPGAGHLVHMPGHIDIRLGRYHDAILANEKGIASDLLWTAERGGFYTLYRAHNYHFLTYAAMFDGQKALAMKTAREMVKQLPLELVRAYPDFLDGFIGAPVHVMVRFGMWDELLKEQAPPEDLVGTTAFWRYGRTVAFASLGRVEEAAAEFEMLKKAYAQVPESRYMGNNPVLKVLEVGLPVAEGELEYRRKNYDRAFELLGEGVKRDVALRYDEPWGWMMPVRHALGALLLEQGRVADAEAVYREDLKLHPDNGWALTGLAECQRRSGKDKEAAATEAKIHEVWARADISPGTSCYCRKPGS